MFYKNSVYKNFSELTGKYLYQNLFLMKLQAWAGKFIKKETLAHLFSSEFCENFNNTFFTEHLRTTASVHNFCNIWGEKCDNCIVRIVASQKAAIPRIALLEIESCFKKRASIPVVFQKVFIPVVFLWILWNLKKSYIWVTYFALNLEVRNKGQSLPCTTLEIFINLSQSVFTCSKLTMETLEQCGNV